MAEERDIKYVNRDFTDFRSQLVEYAKNYFPDTYNDFSPTSPGMMFIEMAAYVGDILSFYQDSQLQETYLTYAKDPKNLYSLAYMMGYKPKVTGVSEVEIEATQTIDTLGSPNYQPNWATAANISADTIFTSSESSKTTFLLNKGIDFRFSSSYDPTEVTITDIENNNPTGYTLKKKIQAFSGQKKTTTFTLGNVEKFKTLTIEDSRIVGILDITDSENNKWYEVPFLGQDTIFVDESNTSSDSNEVPFNLKLKKVPKRFVTRFLSSGFLQLQFGAGTTGNDDSTILPDPSNVGLGTSQGVSRVDQAYDPSNFLYSRSYGISPNNTTLTVTYIVGGGVTSNVPANTITVASPSVNSVTFNNLKPAAGGRDSDTVDELRENSLRSFNEQNRTVTLQDYNIRTLALPSKYGSVAKAFVTQDQATNTNTQQGYSVDNNPLALSLYILAYDNKGKLVAAQSTLKNNLKTYLGEYMLVTDAINIKDAFVVNIGVNFDVIVRPDYAGRDVILNCTLKLKDYFNIKKWSINQPINISDIYSELDKVKGVQTVQKVEIVNKAGGVYSQYGYDTTGATKSNIVYPSYDPCVFEVKFPDTDIKGRITTM